MTAASCAAARLRPMRALPGEVLHFSEAPAIERFGQERSQPRYSAVNWISCQPRAPEGKTRVRASG
jgi:hypothetical protein